MTQKEENFPKSTQLARNDQEQIEVRIFICMNSKRMKLFRH
jgi:hypothetical protein